MYKTLVAAVCLVVCSFASMSCSKSATFSTKDGTVTVEQKGGDPTSMTITAKDGKGMTMNMGEGKVPDDYPKDLPVYTGAKVVLTQSVSDKNARSLMLESSDPTDKISEFYKKGLESNGWKIENTMTSGDMTMFTAIKDNRQAVLQIMNGGDKRTISQVLSDK